jgi:hypothetical protein
VRLGYVIDMCGVIAHGTRTTPPIIQTKRIRWSPPLYNDGNNECCHFSMQITLLSVYKMDEATKKPTTDAAAIEKFTVKLKKLAARQVDLQTPSQCMASNTPLCKVSQA